MKYLLKLKLQALSTFLFFIFFIVQMSTVAQTISIPDTNFEQALIDLGFDTNGLNGNILEIDALAVTQLYISDPVNNPNFPNVNAPISDLTGLEGFTNLERFSANDNSLTSIDVTQNTALELLFLKNNQISTIDISNNLSLTLLSLEGNNLSNIDVSSHTALAQLYLGSNNLSSIDVTNNINLDRFYINDNQLTSIDVSNNTLLKRLWLHNNLISTIDVTNNTALELLYLEGNLLTSVDVSQNTNLFNLAVGYNSITSLDVTNLTVIEALTTEGTLISSLDLSQNTILEQLVVSDNPNLTSIDVSNNPQLWNLLTFNTPIASLDLSNNAITSLYAGDNAALSFMDLRNGNNVNMTVFDVPNTPNLTCINTDAVTAQVMVDSGKVLSTDCGNTTTIAIPDSNFEQALIDLGYDTNGLNGNILETNALTVTNLYIGDPLNNVNLPNVNVTISDLTGIESFTNLVRLYANDNSITTIDVTQNVLLERLQIHNNQIASIDVTNNTALEVLWLENNLLTSVDVSQNTSLLNLAVGLNPITSLDVTNLTVITNLTTEVTQISAIDLSQNPELRQMWIADNPNLTSIDVSNNPLLFNLGIYNTSISSLDLSNNAIETLYAGNNASLSFMDFRNGNNINVTVFDVSNNPLLTCINTDATTSQVMVDSGKVLSTDCNNTTTIAIPDANFEQALIDLGFDTNGLNGNILETNALAVTQLYISDPLNNANLPNVNATISDLTGLEGFTNLERFAANENSITSIDVTQNTALEWLFLRNNQLSSIDISNNLALTRFSLEGNTVSSIDVSSHSALTELYLGSNNFSSIDVSNNIALDRFYINDNQITSIDVSNNTLLKRLWLHNNLISTIDVTSNTALELLYLEGNLLTSVDVSQNISLLNLAVGLNPITSLDVTNLTVIQNLTTEVTQISALDLSQNVELRQMWIADNPNLTSIDLSNNPLLWNLGVYNTPLESLDLSNNAITSLYANDMPNLYRLDLTNGMNTSVTYIDITNNPSLECISVDDAAYSTANWTEVDPTAAFSEDCNSVWTVYTTDPNLDTAINAYLGVIDTDMDGVMSYEEASNYTGTLDLSGSGIIDITGLEAFTSVTEINLSGNSITDISSLIFGNVVTLTRNDLQFKTVERRAFNSLQILNCSNNNLKSLDVSIITTLTSLDCSNNQLEVFNVKNGNNTNFVNFDASGNPSLYCALVDDISYSNTNWTAIDNQTLFSDTDCNAKLQPKVFLQGAMLNPVSGEEHLMRDNLRSLGYIPTTSPYVDGLTCDVSVFNVTGDNAIVDWVEISLRNALSPGNKLQTRSALLQRDGDVVDVDGVSEIAFNLWAKSYYVSINHRNHLGVMSNGPNILNFTPSTFNFSDGSISTYGTNAQVVLGSGDTGLWAGNTNGDHIIQYSGVVPDSPSILSFVLNDPSNIFNLPTHFVDGYYNFDVDMNGRVQYTGSTPETPFILQNVLAHPGNVFNLSTHQILEQLP